MNRRTIPSLKPSERVFVIHRETAELLARPVRGRGGFQTLLRRMQAGLFFAPHGTPVTPSGLAGDDVFHGDVLVVDVDDVDALVARSSGGRLRRFGGFQQRVLALVTDILLNNLARPDEAPGQQRLPFTDSAPTRARKDLRVIQGGRL